MRVKIGWWVIIWIVVFVGCTTTQTPTIPATLPLERIVIEPGERVRLRLPPDVHSGPAESHPRAYLEFVITDTLGRSVRAMATIDGEVKQRDIDRFVHVMPDPERQTAVRISAPGYEMWELALRFNLKHTRRFEIPVVLQSNPD